MADTLAALSLDSTPAEIEHLSHQLLHTSLSDTPQHQGSLDDMYSEQRPDYSLSSNLYSIDQELDLRHHSILFGLDALASSEDSVETKVLNFLHDELEWLGQTSQYVQAAQANDSASQAHKAALIARIDNFMDAIECYVLILKARVVHSVGSGSEPSHLFDTSKLIAVASFLLILTSAQVASSIEIFSKRTAHLL